MISKITNASLWKGNALLLIAFAVILISMDACSPKVVTSYLNQKYYEDLSVYRPNLQKVKRSDSTITEAIAYVPPTKHIGVEIDSIVALTKVYNRKKNAFDGYTIQVYTGTVQDDANKAQLAVYGVMEEAEPWIDYYQPVYKVKVGKFYSKIEANRLYKILKRTFPDALMIPQKFRIK